MGGQANRADPRVSVVRVLARYFLEFEFDSGETHLLDVEP